MAKDDYFSQLSPEDRQRLIDAGWKRDDRWGQCYWISPSLVAMKEDEALAWIDRSIERTGF